MENNRGTEVAGDRESTGWQEARDKKLGRETEGKRGREREEKS